VVGRVTALPALLVFVFVPLLFDEEDDADDPGRDLRKSDGTSVVRQRGDATLEFAGATGASYRAAAPGSTEQFFWEASWTIEVERGRRGAAAWAESGVGRGRGGGSGHGDVGGGEVGKGDGNGSGDGDVDGASGRSLVGG